MAKGRSLTIGLNSVDPRHYAGWSGELNACEADAKDMAGVARSKKFNVKTLLTKSATRTKIIDEIAQSAKVLKGGDIFMLSYSGHGGQLPDFNHDEPDGQDETWCLYDGQLVDDEIYAHLSKFEHGVRIVVFSDSCHSGSVVKLVHYKGNTDALRLHNASEYVRYRYMPIDVVLRTYRENKIFYDKILSNDLLRDAKNKVKASILLISGCQDNQLSADGKLNGLFTSRLLNVWKGGTFTGDYIKFYKEILRLMPPDQTPNFFRAGQLNKKFESQTPFSI